MRLEDPRAFKSWLYQAVRWQTLDLLKKSQHEQSWLCNNDIEQIGHVERNSGNDELKQHIEQLAEIDKQAIHLFYLEDMSIQEISIVLAIPTGTVKSRLNRARQTLKQKNVTHGRLEVTSEI